MLNLWSLLAVGVATLLFQALIAAAWMVLGGMGGTWRVNQALSRQTDEIHRIDERISREVKTRAGRQGREKATEAASLEEQAREVLAAAPPVVEATERPSVIGLVNGAA